MATEKVVSTLYDYDPYAIYRAVADRHTAYPMFRQMLRMQNATRAVSAPTTGHYERDWRFNLVTFASIDATTAAGEDAVYTLDASSMYDLSVNVSGSARQASAVRVGDIIESYTGARILVTAKTTSSTRTRSRSNRCRPAWTLTLSFPPPARMPFWQHAR